MSGRRSRATRAVSLCAASLAVSCSTRLAAPIGPHDSGATESKVPEEAAVPVEETGVSAPDDASGDEASDLPSTLNWTAVSANFVEGDIVSVWGTSSTDVYVGTDMESVYLLTGGYATWTGLAPQVIGAGWGSDPQAVYAVGASAWLESMGLMSSGGLFHYAGDKSWAPIAAGTFYSVWGSSANDVYAGGPGGIVHSIHGGSFVGESSDGGAVPPNILSVWGTGPTDVYAGTSTGAVLHSAGDGQWQASYAEPGSQAWAGWSSGPDDAYAILASGGSKDPTAHLVHSRSGAWTSEPVSTTATTLVTLWGSSATDVYAGGWHVDSAGKGGDLFHSSGDGVWTRISLPGTPYDVRCIWGSGATDVYVAIYDVNDGPVLLHGQP